MQIQEMLMSFFSQYEWWQFVLALLGILYVLDKYFGISPVDKLIDREKKYTYKKFNHLHDPVLQKIIQKFNTKQFSEVEASIRDLHGSYRSFAFRSLGQFGKLKMTDEWLAQNPDSEIAKIIKSYQLIHLGGEARGHETIDKVSDRGLHTYQDYLAQARELLEGLTSRDFQTNIASNLLTIYKSSKVERELIHKCFQNAYAINKNDAELHFDYFSAISYKWGGNDEEMQSYFTLIEESSDFIQKLIYAQYYFDLIYFDEYEDTSREVERFLIDIKNMNIDENELYKYELYLLASWNAGNLGYEKLKKHFKKCIYPYWRD